MSKRYHETPMDFEYQNGTGPMDAKSPFAAVSMNAQRFPATPSGVGSRKSVFSSLRWNKTADDNRENVNTSTDAAPPKGDYSAFDSPARPGASRNPSPNKALPPVPGNGFSGVSAFNSMFTTPRKPMQDTHMEDSSAGETPKSPERQDDSEAGTPAEILAFERRRLGGGLDTRSAPAIPTVSTLSMSPSKEMGRERTRERESKERRERRPSPVGKKESFFGRVKRSFNSPGRGEIPRAETTHNRDQRVVRKKSQRSLAITKRRDMDPGSGSDAENDDSELIPASRMVSPRKRSANYNQAPPFEQQEQQAQQQPPPQKEPGMISSLFTFIGAHPTIPHILSFYAQLAFNVFLLMGCAWIIWAFYSAIRGDIEHKAFEASADIMAEMAEATEHYRSNECGSDTYKRFPALRNPCETWERVMAREPMKIAHAKVGASAFAEIFNSFVEPISYKAMLFTALIVFGCFGVSNFAFGVLRNKAMEQQHTQQHWTGPYNFQAPPPTPQRNFSGLVEGQGNYQGTPWHGGPALEPAPSQRYAIEDGQGSPRRRLVYN
jgi:hypothetical protein